MATEAKVCVDAYELVKSALPVIGRFPRSHRFTLGERIEGRLFDLIEFLEQARFGHKRAEALDLANVRVQVVGALFRLACDLRFLSAGQYGELAERLTGVGRQVGGWRRSMKGDGGGPV